MRCFLAVDIENNETLDKLFSIALKFNIEGVKIVEKENLHITLRFLGEIKENEVEELKRILSNVKFKKFEARISSLGCFPNLRRPRVVWAGIKEGFAELKQLYELIDYELRRNNYIFPKEDFYPHVTIARVKNFKAIENVINLIESYHNEEFGKIIVNKFILKQSTLTSRGPIYTNLKVFEI